MRGRESPREISTRKSHSQLFTEQQGAGKVQGKYPPGNPTVSYSLNNKGQGKSKGNIHTEIPQSVIH